MSNKRLALSALLLYSIVSLAVPDYYNRETVKLILSADDGDTLSFNYENGNANARFCGVIDYDTIFRYLKGFSYYTKDYQTPYYAVIQKKDQDIISTIYNKANTIEEIARFKTDNNDNLCLNGLQEFFVKGKRYYSENYHNDRLNYTCYLDTAGDIVNEYIFKQITWNEFQNSRDISVARWGDLLQLVQKNEYYPAKQIKSKTYYRCDGEGKIVTKSEYYNRSGRKQSHKDTDAAKTVQDYINKHFAFDPVKTKDNAITKMDLSIPVNIDVDSTGLIRSIALNGKITYKYEMITGYTATTTRDGVVLNSRSATYDDNNEVKAQIRQYGDQITDSLRVFIQGMDTLQLLCSPEFIGETGQSAVVKTTLKRDCLKKYKIANRKHDY